MSVVAGGLVLAVLAGLGVGFAWSRSPRWFVRAPARVITHLAAAALIFWVALWSSYLAGSKLGWIPEGEYCDLVAHDGECGGVRDWAHHLIAPWIAVALALFAIYARVARVAAIRVRSERGRALAVSARRREAAAFVRRLGFDFAFALGVATFAEVFWALPGLGYWMLVAVGQHDYPMIQGVAIAALVLAAAAHLVADLAAGVLDPASRGVD